MGAFDPNQPFEKLDDPQGPPQFDPNQPFENLDQGSSPHDLTPFLKGAGKGLVGLATQAGSGLAQAIAHPLDTAENVKQSLQGADAEGAYRAVRNIPLGVGQLIDKGVEAAQGIPGYLKGGDQGGLEAVNAQDDFRHAQEEADAKHMQEHPLTDFIQRSAGTVLLPGGNIARGGALVADTLARSIGGGNSAGDVLKDTRNAALLGGIATGVGAALPKVAGTAADYASKGAEWALPKIGLVGGASAGSTLGPAGAVIGGKIGEEAGRLADTYGRAAVQAVSDAGIKLHAVLGDPNLERVIMTAAQDSPKSLAITHYILNQSNPEYQAAQSMPEK